MIELKKSMDFAGPEGPVVLVIMDGIGIGKNPESDFVKQANTPNLNWLHDNALYTELRAHGVAVGLPDDGDMGNSEVGHNAIGCGRVFEQGAALVGKAIASGAMYAAGSVWQELVSNVNRQILDLALYRPVFGWQCALQPESFGVDVKHGESSRA